MKGSKYLFLIAILFIGLSELFGQDQPNILWISVEDISPDIGCYGDKNAHTPVLDKLAENGVRYTNAIANAPVCAPARSVIITGMYQTSIGSQHMRCKGRMPEGFKYYPQILRDKGYFCTNNQKEDYNLVYDS
ncbi:MAG: sulfatase-like hydrolase/transferase, partial [Cyclobacteriaceae bacterium]|nr:sulfatase-like hydrolase/transferase [Cyclobacteriaceae bacterium]